MSSVSVNTLWAGLDLNQRRQSQWIYSPPPLTTRTPTQTPSPGFEPGTKRLTVARSTAELRRIDITLISMLAMGHVFNPNILTVCNGAKRVTISQSQCG